MNKLIVCVDFDGTCVTHEFPEVGKDIGAVPVLKKITEAGHKLVLFTMRSEKQSEIAKKGSLGWDNPEQLSLDTNVLEDAVNWFKKHNIPLYGINENPEQKTWTNSPKAYGQIYIDDAALGCPTAFNPELSFRPYVDWHIVESMLKQMKVI
ncbi:MAG TPA: hypothetical protein DHV48_03525 [Prolixibacteraceae bacterium]|nr:hypothetical protein [Prolixibacteraceae bacterium]